MHPSSQQLGGLALSQLPSTHLPPSQALSSNPAPSSASPPSNGAPDEGKADEAPLAAAPVLSLHAAANPQGGSGGVTKVGVGGPSVPSTPRQTASPPSIVAAPPASAANGGPATVAPSTANSHPPFVLHPSHAQPPVVVPSSAVPLSSLHHPPSASLSGFPSSASSVAAQSFGSSASALPFGGSGADSLMVDGVSDSEVDSDDGGGLHPLGMGMIEEEDEDESIEENVAGGAGHLRGGPRRRNVGAYGGPAQRSERRGGDAFDDEGGGSHRLGPSSAYGPSFYPPYYHPSHLPPPPFPVPAYSPYGYPPYFPSPFFPHPPSGGWGSSEASAPPSLQSPSSVSAAAGGVGGGWFPSPPPSSASHSVFSSPISFRGLRAFVFCAAVLNAGCVLVRDASVQSFGLFLALANAVLALCVLTGRPFSLAVLLQAQRPQAHTAAAASAGRPAVRGEAEAASSGAATAAASAQLKAPAASSSSASPGRMAVPSSAKVGAVPLSSPSARAAPLPSQSSAPLVAAPVTAASSPPPTVAPAFFVAAAAVQSDGANGVGASSAPSGSASASGSPLPSRSPSPSPTAPAVAAAAAASAAPSPSPFPSATPQYDSGPWTVAPLPLFTRGFTRKVVAGASTRYSDKPELATWCRTAGESFMVRMGPKYARTKAKSASAPSLYECVGLDIFQTDSKVDHIARLLRLPLPPERLRRRAEPATGSKEEKRRKASAALAQAAAAYAAHQSSQADAAAAAATPAPVDPAIAALLAEFPDGDFLDCSDDADGEYVPNADDALIGVPPLWLINFQIPAYAPPMPMWGKKEDGEGYSVVLYYRLTDEAKDDLRQNLTPAARLLKTFTANVGEERWHGRYKSIPKIMNPDDCEVGRTVRSLIQSYNAKPFLTGPWCHAFIKGPGYVEVPHHHLQRGTHSQATEADRSRTH